MLEKALSYHPRIHLSILIGLGLLFLLPFLGKVHLFDWDEINFAECSREMLLTGNYSQVQINFEPFWEKPPLFFWIQALCMKFFGINEFSARLPNAIAGILSLIAVYLIGKKEKNKAFGFIWAIAYFGSLLPHLYFKSGIIDPVFNLFIFLSVYFFYRTLQGSSPIGAPVLSGTLAGLAVITKGPVGLLLLMLATVGYSLLKKLSIRIHWSSIIFFCLAFVGTTFLWYGPEMIKNGSWFLREFIQYQIDLFRNPVAGHAQPFYYHFVVVFFGCFPMSIFALESIRGNTDTSDYKKWMISLFWVVMILFSVVTTKIVHYSSMAYLPLAFLAADFISSVQPGEKKKFIALLYLIVGLLLSSLILALLIAPHFEQEILPLIDNPFTKANLMQDIQWNGWEFIIGLILITAILWSYFKARAGLWKQALFISSGSIAIFLISIQAIVLPKIEAYSQGGAITIYEDLSKENVYVVPVGFKSYAQYFYGRTHEKIPPLSQLLKGDIDRPAYFITRVNDEVLKKRPEVIFLKNSGGFSLYKRDPTSE